MRRFEGHEIYYPFSARGADVRAVSRHANFDDEAIIAVFADGTLRVHVAGSLAEVSSLRLSKVECAEVRARVLKRQRDESEAADS